MAIQHQSDPGGIKNESTDLQRDIAAKGGPAVGLGNPANRQASSPASNDLQTQASSKAKQKSKSQYSNDEGSLDEPTRESQTRNRSGNHENGSNH